MSDSTPENYPLSGFHFMPSKAAAIAAGVVYAILTVALLFRLCLRRNWWGLCLPIGTAVFSSAFFIRLVSTENPSDFASYVTTQLFTVVSPAAFLAFNYILYGRFISIFATGRSKYTLMRPELVARVFIISDVLTFLVQGGGGGLQASDGTANIGRIILLIGIIVQGLSYVVFYVLLVYSHRTFNNDSKFDRYNFPWLLLYIMHFSSIMIMIRSVFRVVELIQGRGGYLLTHEVFLYTLDTIPLFLATAIYAIFWPGDLMRSINTQDTIQMDPLYGRVNDA